MPASLDAAPSPGGRRSLADRLLATSAARWALRLSVVELVLAPLRGDRSVHRFMRYSLVSGIAIVISQVTILICTLALGLSGIAANAIGAFAATPASYELNRKWAWKKGGKSHLWREVVPFWALTLAGFLASTGTVEVADNMAKSHHVHGLERSLAIMAASLLAWGVVWIVKFVIFNRLLFAGASHHAPAPGPVTAPTTAPAAAGGPVAATVPAPVAATAPGPVAATVPAPVAGTAPAAVAGVAAATVPSAAPSLAAHRPVR